MPSDPKITTYLEAHAAGEDGVFAKLVDEVYEHLRYLARRQIARDANASLSSCALVHEAYLKLVGAPGSWRQRGHFFAAASQAMRHVLVDAARRRRRSRHGGEQVRVDLEDEALALQPRDDSLLALEQALCRLQAKNLRLVRVVECRYFAGLSEAETAVALELSIATVQRDWRSAKAWLAHQLASESEVSG